LLAVAAEAVAQQDIKHQEAEVVVVVLFKKLLQLLQVPLIL
jgi:hypothetical protein